MNAWNPGGQPPYDPHRGPQPQPGPYPPPPLPNGGLPPQIPHPSPQPFPPQPFPPQPFPPHPYPPYPFPPAPAPSRTRRLRQRVGPIFTARRVFKPSRPGIVDDELVARIQKIRTLVGLAAVVWVSMSYKLAKSVSAVVNDRTDQSWYSVLMLSVTLPVAVGVLLAVAAPAARRELLRRAARCLGSIVALIAAVGVFPLSVLTGFASGRLATSPLMVVVTVLGMVVTVFWVLPFICWGVGLALVHVFRTADIHETVPPLLAMILVWEMAVVDVFTGAYAGTPGALRTLLILGAPVSVTAVGLWELHRLRVHHNIAVRDMLMR